MKPRRLPSGAWNCRVMIGGQSYSFTHTDKKTVMRMASDFADAQREKVRNPTLSQACEDFIAEREKTLSPSTIRSYRGIAGKIAERNPSVMQKKVIVLTDKDIYNIVRPLRTLKTKRNYVNFLQSATGRKFSVNLTGTASHEIAVPTDLEVMGLLVIFQNTEMEIPVMLGAFGGLRRGEICALNMGDFDGDYVTINKDKVMDEFGGYVIKDPKTETSNRTILLPHFVVEAIREKGYVTKLTPHQISNYFQKKQMSLGVEPPYCFHSLRHYNASFLHSQGIPDAYIMARGGWASPHVMQRVYRHALQDKVAGMEQKAVGALQFSLQF